MIVGEKEIARNLQVKENTVHQWMVKRLLPRPDGSVSGNPAWYEGTIRRWAWETGREPNLRVRVLALLAERPTGGSFATPLTHDLIKRGWAGPDTTPTKIASVRACMAPMGCRSARRSSPVL